MFIVMQSIFGGVLDALKTRPNHKVGSVRRTGEAADIQNNILYRQELSICPDFILLGPRNLVP
jgi:hypothetical protein